MNAGAYIVRFLESAGIFKVYCVPGESYLPVLEALRHSAIETLTLRHESAAGYMALVDGRLTDHPGVVMVSRGPGATNASIAIHTAQQDAIPLLLFVGQVERRHLRRDGFQEIDYGKMFGDIAKWVIEVHDPNDLPQTLSRAYSMAISGTPGPVVISLPEDVLELDVEFDEIPTAPPPQAPVSGPPREPSLRILDMIRGASRPLILAGMEFSKPGGRDVLMAFAEKFDIPVAVSFRRHDLFAHQHPLYAGDMSSTNTPTQRQLFESADLVLALGTRMGDLTTHGYTFPRSPTPRQTVVHVYNDSSLVGRHYNLALGIACKAPDLLKMLLESCSDQSHERGNQWASSLHEAMLKRSTLNAPRFEDGVVFSRVVSAISRHVGDNVSIVPDAGISAAQVYRYFPFYGGRRLYATMAGVMGFGIPGSIAVAMREPDRRVICLVGDGGFMMTGFELAIAVQKRLPICIFLANNRSLGTIYLHQEKHYPGGAHATDLAGPDFTLLAKAFGCQTLRIEQEDEIDNVVARALGEISGPVLVDVRTSLLSLNP